MNRATMDIDQLLEDFTEGEPTGMLFIERALVILLCAERERRASLDTFKVKAPECKCGKKIAA